MGRGVLFCSKGKCAVFFSMLTPRKMPETLLSLSTYRGEEIQIEIHESLISISIAIGISGGLIVLVVVEDDAVVEDVSEVEEVVVVEVSVVVVTGFV